MNNDLIKRIEYTECFIAFLDVLGFKKLVFSSKPEDQRKIEEYFGLIEEVTSELKEIKAKKGLGSLIISDSVILSMPVEDDILTKIDKFRHLCIAVAKIQSMLAMKGIWLRGAISSGEAYFDPQKNNIVGKAYIDAYILCESKAIFPRVIIDHKIITELGKPTSQDLIEEINKKTEGGLRFANWNSDVLFDWRKNDRVDGEKLVQDVAMFIDYLSPSIEDLGKFKELINNIEKMIYSDNSIYSKFKWIMTYMSINCASKMGEGKFLPGEKVLKELDNLYWHLRRY